MRRPVAAMNATRSGRSRSRAVASSPSHARTDLTSSAVSARGGRRAGLGMRATSRQGLAFRASWRQARPQMPLITDLVIFASAGPCDARTAAR
jgi:hypothetical protein